MAGLEGWSLQECQTCVLLVTSPSVDLPRPPETTAAVVTAPHSRARDAINESLVHVPLETFLDTLESSGGSGSDSNNTGTVEAASSPSLSFTPSLGHGHPWLLPRPFLSLRSHDISSHRVLCIAAQISGFCRPVQEHDPSHGLWFQ